MAVNWEYCVVHVATYREGSGGAPRELLDLTLPGGPRTSVTHPLGAIGMLNQLGGKGWELVDVEPGVFWLKRRTRRT